MTWWNHWEDYGDPSVGQSVTVAGVFLLFILLVLLLSVLAAELGPWAPMQKRRQETKARKRGRGR